ncbi:hypothetical protein D922_04344 [Enterococcus faecalis 06-MB-DW-09]|nr:hypothetical protein D931_02558 [Enterococcus faecium 13.SD.W.09]EPH87415.1 hypothetical protein D922_04344 [Enterococcus faecalis 06-MB-DW-09]
MALKISDISASFDNDKKLFVSSKLVYHERRKNTSVDTWEFLLFFILKDEK